MNEIILFFNSIYENFYGFGLLNPEIVKNLIFWKLYLYLA